MDILKELIEKKSNKQLDMVQQSIEDIQHYVQLKKNILTAEDYEDIHYKLKYASISLITELENYLNILSIREFNKNYVYKFSTDRKTVSIKTDEGQVLKYPMEEFVEKVGTKLLIFFKFNTQPK
jgi:hypothetical protein